MLVQAPSRIFKYGLVLCCNPCSRQHSDDFVCFVSHRDGKLVRLAVGVRKENSWHLDSTVWIFMPALWLIFRNSTLQSRKSIMSGWKFSQIMETQCSRAFTKWNYSAEQFERHPTRISIDKALCCSTSNTLLCIGHRTKDASLDIQRGISDIWIGSETYFITSGWSSKPTDVVNSATKRYLRWRAWQLLPDVT